MRIETAGIINFQEINRAAMSDLAVILHRWLPDGKIRGHEFIARNPTRADRRPGSFSINLNTGVWKDFSSGDKGGDPVSLCAFLFGLSQGDAAKKMGDMLGVNHG